MKILLIIPRYNLTSKKNYKYLFPLGLAYISSFLKSVGYEVECLNLNHLNGTMEYIINKSLNSKKYDFVCSGHMAIGYAIIEKIIKIARNHKSKPKIIIGGALMTSEPKLMFNSLKPDFAIIGEGEKTIVELLKRLEKKRDLKKVDGICYRDKNGKLFFTKPREVIKNLDSLPFPDFEGFGFKEQLDNRGNEAVFYAFDYPRSYPILCTRGCPYQCTFCYHSLGKKYRARSIDNVMQELEIAIKKYKINSIEFIDDSFSIDKKRLYKFCKRIKKLIEKVPWECKWICQLVVNTVDKEMLKTLKDSGCYSVSFGFESYSPKVLKSMRKPITPQQIDNAIRLSMEVGIGIQGNFIFGDVAETNETAYETLNYWKKNCKGQVRLGFIQPYPGSAIYHHCVKKRIIKDKLNFIKNKISHTNWLNMTDNMSDKEILELKKDILKARRKYGSYIIPSKIKKTNKNKYEIKVKCPFCNEIINYKNCYINNKFHYAIMTTCRNCCMRFYIVSFLYKIGVDYYEELDFFRRNYLLIHDNILKKRL